MDGGPGALGGAGLSSPPVAAARRTARGRPAPWSRPPRSAASKSAVMPIDSSPSSRRPASSRSGREPAPGVLGRRRDGHQAPHRQPERRQPVAKGRRGAGRASTLLRLSGQVHLDQHRGAGGVPGEHRTELGPVDGLPARDPRRERAHLVALERAEEVPARRRAARARARAPAPWRAAPGRGSHPGRSRPRRARPRRRVAGTVFVAATSVTDTGSRPARRAAAAMRARTDSMFRAITAASSRPSPPSDGPPAFTARARPRAPGVPSSRRGDARSDRSTPRCTRRHRRSPSRPRARARRAPPLGCRARAGRRRVRDRDRRSERDRPRGARSAAPNS